MAPAEPQSAAGAADGGLALRIEVIYCPEPGRFDLVTLTLPPGATVADALQASGMVERHGLSTAELRVGVWAKVREPSTPLRDRDRVEIYRPLTVDPKEARRQRYRREGRAGRGARQGSQPGEGGD